MSNNNQNNKDNIKGFTLIELMVATSIFVVVMLMAIGSLTISSDSARKSKALRSAMDNVSFAMEEMSRSLRMGTDYTCITDKVNLPVLTPLYNDCPLGALGGGAIAFTPYGHSATPRDTAYSINGSTGVFSLQKCNTTAGCLDLTSPEVNIEVLKFFVDGSDPLDATVKKQPSIFIIIKGTVKVKDEISEFSLQTIVSQRSIE